MESLTAETTANPPRATVARADLLAYGVLGLGVLAHLAFLVSLRTGWRNPIFNDSMHRFGLVAQSLGAALTYLTGVHAYGLWLILCELALLRSIRVTVEMAPDRLRPDVLARCGLPGRIE